LPQRIGLPRLHACATEKERCAGQKRELTLKLTPECMLSLTVDTIRFYERQRLLKHLPRTEGGFRQFSAQDVQNINFIRRAQKLGFSLNEIRELLFLQSGEVRACSHVRDLLREKLSSVREKIAELEKLERQLAGDLKKCEGTLRTHNRAQHVRCPVLDEIADSRTLRTGR
jgi:DNA-binding transcriptional MerR regulator